jgi:hypothetical protein
LSRALGLAWTAWSAVFELFARHLHLHLRLLLLFLVQPRALFPRYESRQTITTQHTHTQHAARPTPSSRTCQTKNDSLTAREHTGRMLRNGCLAAGVLLYFLLYLFPAHTFCLPCFASRCFFLCQISLGAQSMDARPLCINALPIWAFSAASLLYIRYTALAWRPSRLLYTNPNARSHDFLVLRASLALQLVLPVWDVLVCHVN